MPESDAHPPRLGEQTMTRRESSARAHTRSVRQAELPSPARRRPRAPPEETRDEGLATPRRRDRSAGRSGRGEQSRSRRAFGPERSQAGSSRSTARRAPASLRLAHACVQIVRPLRNPASLEPITVYRGCHAAQAARSTYLYVRDVLNTCAGGSEQRYCRRDAGPDAHRYAAALGARWRGLRLRGPRAIPSRAFSRSSVAWCPCDRVGYNEITPDGGIRDHGSRLRPEPGTEIRGADLRKPADAAARANRRWSPVPDLGPDRPDDLSPARALPGVLPPHRH